jgi:hypothetical protein
MNIPCLQSEMQRPLPSRHPKRRPKVSSNEDSNIDEDVVAILAKNFKRFMNNKFKKKFSNRLKKAP